MMGEIARTRVENPWRVAGLRKGQRPHLAPALGDPGSPPTRRWVPVDPRRGEARGSLHRTGRSDFNRAAPEVTHALDSSHSSLVLSGLRAADLRAGDLKAGAFAIDVTPEKFPVSVNGGFSDRKASTANDPLHARCLVLDDGTTKLAIVVVDSCMIPRDVMDAAKALAAKKTGIPAAHMLISATHTHTAPTVAGVFQSEPDAEYIKRLTQKNRGRHREGAHKARCAPAKLAWGVAGGTESGVQAGAWREC